MRETTDKKLSHWIIFEIQLKLTNILYQYPYCFHNMDWVPLHWNIDTRKKIPLI